MRIRIDANEFNVALNRVKKVLGNAKSIEGYKSSILVNCDTGEDRNISIVATDGIIRIETTANAEIVEVGKIMVSGELFSSIISRSSGELLIYTDSEKTIRIKGRKIDFSLSTMNVETFPAYPLDENYLSEFHIPAIDLKEAIEACLTSVGNDNALTKLQGIRLKKIDDEKVEVSSCNGYKLTRYVLPLNYSTGDFEVNVMSKSMQTIKSFISDSLSDMRFIVLQRGLQVIVGNTIIITALLPPNDMDYDCLLPKTYKYRFLIDTTELLGCIANIQPISTIDKEDSIVVSLEDNEIKIVADSEIATGTTTMGIISSEGLEDSISFIVKSSYLSDTIKSIKDKILAIELVDPLKPIIIKSDNKVFLIMPLRNIK